MFLNMSNQTDCMVACLTEETVGGSLFAYLGQLSPHGANRATVSCKHEEVVQGAPQSSVGGSLFTFRVMVSSCKVSRVEVVQRLKINYQDQVEPWPKEANWCG